MEQWWLALSGLQRFFYFIAIPSTVLLAIQFVMTIFGLNSDSDTDMDFDTDTDMDFDTDVDDSSVSAGDFRFITFRGIIAFLTIFGWVGEILADTSLHIVIILFLSTISGLFAMFFVALLFYLISKLQSSGNINYKNALGCLAEVYIPIPKKHTGVGKVQLTIQERLVEADAITHTNTTFNTGDIVRIIDIFNGTTLVVDKE